MRENICAYFKKENIAMMKYPAMKIVGHVVWVVTAIYALNAMTAMHGFDLLEWGPLAGMKCSIVYIVGFCGLVSLVLCGISFACRCTGACAC